MQTDNTLSKILDQDKIQNLLLNLKNDQHDILVWKLLGSEKYLAPVQIDTIRKARGDFVISAIAGSESKVNEIIAGNGSIDFYVPSSGTLFRAKFKHADENRFYMEIPTLVAQLERRKIKRTKVYDSDEFKINFIKKVKTYKEISQHFEKRCFDISSGGFSFFISKSEVHLFKLNDQIQAIKLKVGDWEASFDSDVVRISEIEPSNTNGLTYKALLVSCIFTNMNDISRKQLEKLLIERFQDDLHVINS